MIIIIIIVDVFLIKNKEVTILREDQIQLNEMKNEVARLRTALQTSKLAADRVAELERIIAELTTELHSEKHIKDEAVKEIEFLKKERNEV